MKNIFKQYYTLESKQLKELWKRGAIILDANVLLNLYRFNKKTSDSMMDVLESVGDRLWIPFQAALEYQENRKFVVADQLDAFNKVENVFSSSINQMRNKLNALNLDKRHSTINPYTIIKQVEEKFDEVIRYLQAVQDFSDIEENSQQLRDRIDALITSEKVGPYYTNQQDLEAIYAEGDERYEEQIPPGFKDENKGDEYYVFSGLKYEQKYGDLIVWNQIIDYVNKNDLKNIIFITDDSKEDWWWKKSGKTIGPHKQLIEELNKKTKVDNFWMYSTYSFLKNAETYLKAKVESETFTDIKDVIDRKKNEKLKKLPLSEFYIPILTVLNNSPNGSLPVQECIESIEPILKDKFLSDDLEKLPGTGNIRWETNAKFARNDLRKFGYISNESERGIWEITSEGIDYLKDRVK